MPRVRLDGGVIGVTNNPTSASAGGMWSMKDHEKFTRSSLWPAATSAAPSDTYFNYTSLLLHGDGTNNANNTVFVDSSTSAITLTTNGKPLQGTYSPFSQTGWSNYFDGTGDYLTVPTGAFVFGSNDFTIDSWIFTTAYNTSGNGGEVILDNWIGANPNYLTGQWQLWLKSTGVIEFQYATDATTTVKATSTATIPLSTWTHIAVVRSGSTITVYSNGVSIATCSVSISIGATGASSIGRQTSGSAYTYTGFISNVRVLNGTAQYTSNFTPPITSLTAITNTQLLTCQDNRFKDNSTNNYTITPSGDASVQPFSPFAPSSAYSTSAVGGSISFNGSSDYLSSTSTAFGVGSNSFTVEFWAYKNNAWSTGNQFIVDNGASNGMQIWVNTSAGALRLGRYGVDVILDYAYSSLTPNQWYHIAYVRSGTSVALFINGTRVATATSSASFLTSSTTQNIGRSTDTTSYWNGYISNLRVINGTAAYDPAQTTITVPTSPLTAVASTSLLLNATNAGIIDHTAKNVITTAAGANISTTQSKYGGSSISLSGTSTGYLQMLNTRFNNIPASTDFTLECWLYTTASSTAPNVWHNTSSQRIVAFYLSDSGFSNLDTIMGPFSYPGSNASVVRGTTNIVANTWTHVAFVRSGSTITVYVDGTASGTGTSSYASLPLQLIGAISTGATTPDFYFFPGYIDDLRLTIGVARYTSNFTPKTSAFEDQ